MNFSKNYIIDPYKAVKTKALIKILKKLGLMGDVYHLIEHNNNRPSKASIHFCQDRYMSFVYGMSLPKNLLFDISGGNLLECEKTLIKLKTLDDIWLPLCLCLAVKNSKGEIAVNKPEAIIKINNLATHIFKKKYLVNELRKTYPIEEQEKDEIKDKFQKLTLENLFDIPAT